MEKTHHYNCYHGLNVRKPCLFPSDNYCILFYRKAHILLQTLCNYSAYLITLSEGHAILIIHTQNSTENTFCIIFSMLLSIFNLKYQSTIKSFVTQKYKPRMMHIWSWSIHFICLLPCWSSRFKCKVLFGAKYLDGLLPETGKNLYNGQSFQWW